MLCLYNPQNQRERERERERKREERQNNSSHDKDHSCFIKYPPSCKDNYHFMHIMQPDAVYNIKIIINIFIELI